MPHSGAMVMCQNKYSHQLSVYFIPGSSTFKLKWGECGGRRVLYSVTSGRTTKIAGVSRRQPLDDWKIGPKALDQWEADAAGGSKSMLQ